MWFRRNEYRFSVIYDRFVYLWYLYDLSQSIYIVVVLSPHPLESGTERCFCHWIGDKHPVFIETLSRSQIISSTWFGHLVFLTPSGVSFVILRKMDTLEYRVRTYRVVVLFRRTNGEVGDHFFLLSFYGTRNGDGVYWCRKWCLLGVSETVTSRVD